MGILTTSNGASVLTGGPHAAGWGPRGSVGETGMTAEKELELLKAQVQDIARVCKVSITCEETVHTILIYCDRPSLQAI
jgi:osomolarity two-component system sensor histidine kinase NIK1